MSSIQNATDLVRQYLDARVAAHSVYATNIANSETPNFHAKIPTFKAVLDHAASQQLGEEHWNVGVDFKPSRETTRGDGNNVNLEREMSALAENSMNYLSAVKILTKEMAIARYAATSGGR